MEERLPDRVLILKCAQDEQKSNQILHIFYAQQWRRLYRPGKRNMMPRPTTRDDDYWKNHFRVRLNGRWLGGDSCKYHFYTQQQVQAMVANMLGLEDF